MAQIAEENFLPLLSCAEGCPDYVKAEFHSGLERETRMKFYIGSGLKNSRLVQYYAGILKQNGWQQTYDWTVHVGEDVSVKDIRGYAEAEKQGIADSDVVILLLPAGRGTHVELGMALAWDKKVYLCASSPEDFSIENTVAFYEQPQIVRLTGTADENLKRIMEG